MNLPGDRLLTSLSAKPTIGVIGIASWDTLLTVDQMPSAGETSIVASSQELPGGTSANVAAAAAALGASVELISAVGNDSAAERLIGALSSVGIDCAQVHIDADAVTTVQTVVVTAAIPPHRTIFCQLGAIPRRGHRIDVDRLFTRSLVILDSVDPHLRRFLIDLPVHTYPNAKILVPMTYVVDFPGTDELGSVIRCDAMVGSASQLKQLTGFESLESAIDAMQARMHGSNLRSVAVTVGTDGALAFDADRTYRAPAVPVDVVDTAGADDAFAGAFGVGLACRLTLSESLELANCVAALSMRSLGAQTGLPSLSEVSEFLKGRTIPSPT